MKKEYNQALKKYNDLLDNYKITLENLENNGLNLQDKIGKLTEQKEELEKNLRFEEADKKLKSIKEIQAELNINYNRINLINELLNNPVQIKGFKEIRDNLVDIADKYRIKLLDLSAEKENEIKIKKEEFEKTLEPLYKEKKANWIERTDVEFLLRRI